MVVVLNKKSWKNSVGFEIDIENEFNKLWQFLNTTMY